MYGTIAKIFLPVIVAIIIYYVFKSRQGFDSSGTGSDNKRDSEHRAEVKRERDLVKKYGGETEQLNRNNKALKKQLRKDIEQQREEGFVIRENNRSARESNNRIKEILDNAKDL